jgi:L-alanine-DL-glutamate epimerase-like enolase superfamily enzyme
MNLKLTGLDRWILRVPFAPEIAEWNDLLVWQWQIVELVRLRTDSPSVFGWGESLPHYSWGRTPDDIDDRLKGRNPAELLWYADLGPSVNMALFDLMGRACEVPAHRLMGDRQVRDRCPISWWNTKAPPEVLGNQAKLAAANGYASQKIKARPWFDLDAQIDAISAATPEHFRIDADWNEFLRDAGTAAPVLSMLDAKPKVMLYETPIPHADLQGNRLLRTQCRKPIVHHWGAEPFPQQIRAEACDGFVVTWDHCGGIMKQGRLCAEFNRPFFLQIVGPGLTTAYAAHLGSVLTHARWPMITCLNTWADDLIREPLRIEHGDVIVPSGVGLGVEPDLDRIESMRMDPPYDIPESRRLLTVTWASGRSVTFAGIDQMWEDFALGHHPAQEPNVRLHVYRDDGSDAWNQRYRRAQVAPLYETIP